MCRLYRGLSIAHAQEKEKKRIHEMAETEELKVFKLKTQNSFCGISGF